MGEQLEKYLGYLLAAAIAIIGFFTQRDLSRFDKGLERLNALERDAVTHAQLERILGAMRADRGEMHVENRDALDRIEGKLDAQEERSSKARGDIRDEIHKCSTRLSVIEARLPKLPSA